MICKECGSHKIENRDLMLCGSCNSLARKAAKVKASDNNSPINKMSEKTSKVNAKYLNRLKTWKRGKTCQAHFKHDCSKDITCHHMFGRGNHFHDEWAAENNVPLTLDERFWKPLCTVAHAYITEHSKSVHENGYSYLRITEKVN